MTATEASRLARLHAPGLRACLAQDIAIRAGVNVRSPDWYIFCEALRALVDSGFLECKILNFGAGWTAPGFRKPWTFGKEDGNHG